MISTDKDRLKQQINFIVEIDKLKQVLRQSVTINCPRNENDAEHSWHLAVMAMFLSEYASAPGIDLLRVIKMVLIHDVIEIDAGDTFCYDAKANEDKAEREEKAAQRLFSLLPADQAEELWALWREFEEMKTPESCLAACFDRLEPLLLNYNTQGHTWKKPGVTSDKVLARIKVLKSHAPLLWDYAKDLIEDSVRKGWLKP